MIASNILNYSYKKLFTSLLVCSRHCMHGQQLPAILWQHRTVRSCVAHAYPVGHEHLSMAGDQPDIWRRRPSTPTTRPPRAARDPRTRHAR